MAPTVYLSTPYHYITITSGSDETTSFISTVTPGPGTPTGSVIVYTHFSGPTTTITSFFTNGTSYISTIDASSTSNDTVIVGYLQTFVTTITTSGTVATFITNAQPSGTIPGTILAVRPTPATTCNNLGLEYAIHSNSYTRGLQPGDPSYSAYLPEAFQTSPPLVTGVASFLEFVFTVPHNDIQQAQQQPGSFYPSGPQSPLTQVAINHRGYLFAPQSGIYTFYFRASDDITHLWVGTNAYGSGWDRANANIEQLYNIGVANPEDQVVKYQITLQQGQYVPIRIVWANAALDGLLGHGGHGTRRDSRRRRLRLRCLSRQRTLPSTVLMRRSASTTVQRCIRKRDWWSSTSTTHTHYTNSAKSITHHERSNDYNHHGKRGAAV